jgi:hypothetical protein
MRLDVWVTGGRRLLRVVSGFDRRAERLLAVLEDCVTLEADAYAPAQLATTGLRMVLRRAEESVARTTTAPCGQD